MLEAGHGDRSGAGEVISHGLESRKTSVSWITDQITSITFARTTGASNLTLRLSTRFFNKRSGSGQR